MRCRILKSVWDLPVKLLQGRSDVFNRGSSGDDTSGCILDQLVVMKRFPRKT